MNNTDARVVAEVTEGILASGLRVFLASSGGYGFFTNADGSAVVSFQADLDGVTFSGNYKTSEPRRTGTGWRIDENCADFPAMLSARAPQWATGDATWQYTTLQEHLTTYDKSSKYEEVKS